MRAPLLYLGIALCAGGFVAQRILPARSVAEESRVLLKTRQPETLAAAGQVVDSATSSPLPAVVIRGVQPFALDQPRVPACLQDPAHDLPLSVYVEEIGGRVFAVDAFLDTGSSRITLGRSDAVLLGVKLTGQSIEDVGIGGKETFDVATSYTLRVASSSANLSDLRQFTFTLLCTPQVRRRDQNMMAGIPPALRELLAGQMAELEMDDKDLNEMFSSCINIIGMPFIARYVVILDPRPVVDALNAIAHDSSAVGGRDDVLERSLEQAEKGGGQQFGRIKVDLLQPSQPYPAPQISIPLKLVDMEVSRPPVTSFAVPFVPHVTLQHGAVRCQADFLLDTGGGISLISSSLARRLGLNLAQAPLRAQVQGVGPGSNGLRGFWIDSLTIPSAAGSYVIFTRVPLFVADIAGMDGSLGMNLLGPSVYIDLAHLDLSNPVAILGSLRPGPLPFRRIVVDIPRRRLGLDPA